MSHASGADEYDPVQAAAYAILEQAVPLFDFSDDDEPDPRSLNSTSKPTPRKEQRDAPLSPLQHGRIPFSVVDIFPDGSDDATLRFSRPSTSQLATFNDFAQEVGGRSAQPRNQQSNPKNRTGVQRNTSHLPREPVLDDMFTRISTANGQRPQVRKGRRRLVPSALPSLPSATQAKYHAPQHKDTTALAGRR